MKKIYLLVALVFAGQLLFAQSVKFGIQVGMGFPSLQSDAVLGRGGEYSNRGKYQIGTYLDVKFKDFILQPGLKIVQKGNVATSAANSIWNGQLLPYKIEHDVSLVYLEIPVNGLYEIPAKIGTFYVGAGPYAGFALSGKLKDKTKKNIYVKDVSKEDVEFGNEANQVKSTDFGANVLGGLKLENGINIGLNAGFGLVNISNDPNVKSRNRVFGISVGYLF